jgi:hypothetical protein
MNLINICFWASGIVILTLSAEVAAGIRVELESSVKTIAVQECVRLLVTFANEEESAIEIPQEMFSTDGAGGLQVVYPDETTMFVDKPELNLVQERRLGVPHVKLAPAASHQFHINLCCDWGNNKPIFSSAGKSIIMAVYEDRNWKVTSNSIDVNVTNAPPTEVRVLEFIGGWKRPEVLYAPELTFGMRERENPVLVPALEQAANFNESVIFANYARLTLAKRAIALGEIWRREQVRMGEHFSSADMWLSRITREPPAIKAEIDETRRKLEEYKIRPPQP